VEGLTVSYFRRRIRTADTLMQTGRWFGFRRGYHDLVRVFLGRDEPDGKSSTFDLLEAFKAICMDEEVFRAQLRRYTQAAPGVPPITPKQVPPLVPQHLLQPSAMNKMYNAVLRFKNFGGSWSESTQISSSKPKLFANSNRFRNLLKSAKVERGRFGGTDTLNGGTTTWDAFYAEVSKDAMLALLESIEWIDGAGAYIHEREFLQGSGDHDPGIKRWLVLIPQRTGDSGAYWRCLENLDLKVVRRRQTEDARGNTRFNVFSEPRHRLAAEVIAGGSVDQNATSDTRSLSREGTAVMLLYPAVGKMPDKKELSDGEVSLGFALFFPPNKIQQPLVFGVVDKSNPDAVVVDTHT